MDDQPPPQQPPPVASRPPLAPPPIIYAPPARQSGGSVIWKILTFVLLALLCLTLFSRLLHFSNAVVLSREHTTTDRSRNLEEVVLEQTNGDNKIAVISVDGIITSQDSDRSGVNMVEFISEELKEAESDGDVKAVILKVNSPGGEVMASDDINAAIRKFQEDTHKPVVASMGTLAASGGYYVSAPCRWIVANELTSTGSSGVIMHSWNYRE